MRRNALTVKQRRFVRRYLETGNGTEAALRTYNTDDPRTAHAIAAENLRKPAIHLAVARLLDAEGLSDQRLREIHAHLLSLYCSPDPREKAIALRALDMAYKLTGAYAPERHEIDVMFDDWTSEELHHFAETGQWPARDHHNVSPALPPPLIATEVRGNCDIGQAESEVEVVEAGEIETHVRPAYVGRPLKIPIEHRCLWGDVQEESD